MGSRSAVEVTYTRRWFHGFSVVDNRVLQPSDLTPFSLVAPADARLPGGGGYVVPGLYDVVPEKAGQVDNLVTDSSTFGSWWQRFNGIDLNVNARLGSGLHSSSEARAPARPWRTTAASANGCRSWRRPRRARALSAPV